MRCAASPLGAGAHCFLPRRRPPCCSPTPVEQVLFTDVVWVVREEYVGSTFFDASASRFLLDAAHRQSARHVAQTEAGAPGGAGAAAEESGRRVAECSKRAGVECVQRGPGCGGAGVQAMGNALGPKWTAALRRADRPQGEGAEEDPGGEQPLGRRRRRRMRRRERGDAPAPAAGAPSGPGHAEEGVAPRGALSVRHGCTVRAVRGRGEAEWTPSRGTPPLGAAEAAEAEPAFRQEAASWPLVLLLTDGCAVGCDLAVRCSQSRWGGGAATLLAEVTPPPSAHRRCLQRAWCRSPASCRRQLCEGPRMGASSWTGACGRAGGRTCTRPGTCALWTRCVSVRGVGVCGPPPHAMTLPPLVSRRSAACRPPTGFKCVSGPRPAPWAGSPRCIWRVRPTLWGAD